MLQYVNVPESDFSSGIDARSSENQIPAGFAQDLLNADIVERRVTKRPGYQGFAGNLPLRVTEVEYVNATNEMILSFDESVSLDAIRSTPLVVQGRSSVFTSGQGPITDTDSSHWYSGFSIPARKTLTAPSGTLSVEGTEHGLGATTISVGIVESTSTFDRSHQALITNSVTIDDSTFDTDIGYTTAIDRTVFVYFADRTPVAGSQFVASLSHGGAGSQTFSIPAATHGLANFNIIPDFQQDNGSSVSRVIPDSMTIASNGDVSVTLFSSSATTFYALLSAAPIANSATGVVAGATTGTVSITSLTSPWLFSGIYLEQSPGGTKELVQPDEIEYDDATQTATLTFTNMDASARNFIVFYEYGEVRSNRLTITDAAITVNGTDMRPQLTVWGLDHTDLYGDSSERGGWVTHLDSYRRSGEQRLVSGLGGNLFSSRTYSEAAAAYDFPLLYPSLQARTSVNLILAPLFWDQGEAPARTRGYVTSSSSGTHWATVTAVAYDAGTGMTDYTLSLPSKAILDSTGTPTTLSSVISTTAGLEDYLTVQQMSFSRHNGTFRIVSVTDGSDEITVRVDNSANDSDIWDDSGVAGQAGVFTDQLSFLSTSPFIPSDALISDPLGDVFVCSVVSSASTVSVIDGIDYTLEIPGGVFVSATRTANVVPLRTALPNSVASVENVVCGDMFSYNNTNDEWDGRLLRVLNINADSNRTVSITGTGTIATAVMGSGTTAHLSIGQSILLTNAGAYTGVHVITAIDNDTDLEFSSTETDSVSGTLLGHTVELDEQLTWKDTAAESDYFRTERRWIPVEAPDDSFDLTPSTYIRHLDAGSFDLQTFLRSCMVTDNLYLNNGQDEAMKFDGTNIYRAGLPQWQPGLFLTQETGSSAEIVISNRSITYSAKTAVEGSVTIPLASVGAIPAGTPVRLDGSTQTYTVRDYASNATDGYLFLDRSLDSGVSATGAASEIITFRYYYRLNAVDANNNVIASAVSQSQDYVIELTQNAAVHHKLVGLPAWDNYAYNRLEVQIYRSKANLPAPFYLVTTIPMDFDNTQGYISYVDSFADTDLTELDPVNTALKGAELGTTWSDPLRSKYNTSVGNSLVQANIRDYPQLDMQIVADATIAASAFDGDTLLFLRDSADISTTTNMTDRVKYEWVNGFTDDASNFVIGTDTFTFTVPDASALAAGDWVYLTYSTVAATGRYLEYSGWWQIASIAADDITVNLTGAAIATSYPDKYVVATNPEDVPVLLGVDGNLGMFNGDSFDLFDASRRMAMAINASMRMVDISLTGMEEFTPWLMARGGNDLSRAGRLLIRQPRADALSLSIKPTFSGYELFINSTRRTSGTNTSATTKVMPSRLLISYENYPEIFDNPTTTLDADSDSAIDVNTSDGQEITMAIPFFGESAFGAAQQSGVVVVLKENSLYLVDINEKRAGRPPVQRIETEGLGCTAPFSVTSTRKGIMFANESGIYCLRRDQAIQYIGKWMERNWGRVNKEQLALAQGHHYAVGRKYKLSVPLIDSAENSEAYVYDHTQELDGKQGAWTRYDNHPTTGWCNLASDAFFASSTGRVFSIRRAGTVTDYRDDSAGVAFQLDTRPMDFGNQGVRKVVDSILVHYRTGATATGNTLKYALDTEEEYSETTDYSIVVPVSNTGMDDVVAKRIQTVDHDVGRRRCELLSIRISNEAIDENVEIAGMDLRVGGLTNKGILKAAQSRED